MKCSSASARTVGVRSMNKRKTCDDPDCQECCEHGEYDHGHCLLCGLDCTERLVGIAEAAYEGER